MDHDRLVAGVAALTTLSAMTIAALSAVGWLFHVDVLTSWGMPHARLSIASAAGLECAGIALLALWALRRRRLRFAAGVAAAIGATIVGPVALVIQTHGVGYGLSPATATSLSLIGIATLLRAFGKAWFGTVVAIAAASIAVTDLVAWLYNSPDFMSGFRLMALPTATSVFLLSFGAILAPTAADHRVVDWLKSSLSGVPGRPFLLAVIAVPPLVKAMTLAGSSAGLYPVRLGQVGSMTITIAALIVLVLRTAFEIARLDVEREEAHSERLRSAEVAAALQEREHSIRELAEAVPQIVWIAAADGSMEWYNHRWFEYTGRPSAQAAGWGWQAAIHPDDLQRVMHAWPASIASGKPYEIELRMAGADESYRWFLVRTMPLLERGEVVRWYGTATDIDAQRRAMDRTARIAQTLQEVFLPKRLPKPHGIQIDAVYRTAESDARVGGDWFDAVELPDGRLMFSIGDVAGHGLDASVTVGRVCQTIFAVAFENDDPATVLSKVNQIVSHQEETLITALVGFIDAERTTLRYASAGHPPPVLARPHAGAMLLPYGGLPLGVQSDPLLTTHAFPIERNSVLAVYTDGIIEFSRDLEAVERRLIDAVDALLDDATIARPAVAVLESVVGTATATDDVALLVLSFTLPPLEPDRAEPEAFVRRWRFHSSDAHTARTSRQEVMNYINRFRDGSGEVFETELIVGEILANTVEHAPGLVQIDIDWNGRRPILTVRDTGPGLANIAPSLPGDVLSEDGRGLFLIAALAEDVEIRPGPGFGTEMRVVLPIQRKTQPPLSEPARGDTNDSHVVAMRDPRTRVH